MDNCIILNGAKIQITDEQVTKIKKALKKEKYERLKELESGETFKICGYDFVVLEQLGDTTAVILKGLLGTPVAFSKCNNNYELSILDQKCCEFGEEIKNVIGDEYLIEHVVDLRAEDGSKMYGKIKRRMSCLTADQYRQYVYILKEYSVRGNWWIATAHSTGEFSKKIWNRKVMSVNTDKSICIALCNEKIDIRPFCTLNSEMVVTLR